MCWTWPISSFLTLRWGDDELSWCCNLGSQLGHETFHEHQWFLVFKKKKKTGNTCCSVFRYTVSTKIGIWLHAGGNLITVLLQRAMVFDYHAWIFLTMSGTDRITGRSIWENSRKKLRYCWSALGQIINKCSRFSIPFKYFHPVEFKSQKL